MSYFAKIGDVEHELLSASVWSAGSMSKNSPATVIMTAQMEHSVAKELFANPGEWYVIERYDAIRYADGTVIQRKDTVTDCTDYSVLRSILDTNDGVVKINMGMLTDSEILAELLEVLNG